MASIPPILAGNTVPLSSAQQLSGKIENLKAMLLGSHPAMPGLLREIWLALKKDDELVYLLKEEDIAVIVDGLQKQSQVQIVESVLKKKGSGSAKSLKNMTVEDLGM